jgi:hypothetical protein
LDPKKVKINKGREDKDAYSKEEGEGEGEEESSAPAPMSALPPRPPPAAALKGGGPLTLAGLDPESCRARLADVAHCLRDGNGPAGEGWASRRTHTGRRQ